MNMKFEKLERRCVMDGVGVGGFCTAFEPPAASTTTPAEYRAYGPFLPTDFRPTEEIASGPVELTTITAETLATDTAATGPVEIQSVAVSDLIETTRPLVEVAEGIFEPETHRVEYTGPVSDAGQIYVAGSVFVGKQDVPATTGVRAALDILEAHGGFVHQWANDGITNVYRDGDTYRIEFETPYGETITLGPRVLLVNIGEGDIYAVPRF